MADDILGPSDDLRSALLHIGFHVDVDAGDATLVIQLHGELDMATAPKLARTLNDALDRRPPTIVLDVGELVFLDSTGIRVLIAGSRRAVDQDCSFVLRSPRPRVLRTLKLTGVDRLMAIEG